MPIAIAIFAGAHALIATERVDRTKVALLGGVLVLLTQTIDEQRASLPSSSTRSGCSPG